MLRKLGVQVQKGLPFGKEMQSQLHLPQRTESQSDRTWLR
jgi:hypothetical protein